MAPAHSEAQAKARTRRASGLENAARAHHVLVCISGAQDDLRLIRHGCLLAQRLPGRLTVLYVLSPPPGRRPSDILQADRTFALSVGAPLVEVPAYSVVDGIAEYALERGATHLVLSEERRTPWFATWHGSLVDNLVTRLAGVEIYVLGEANLDVRT